MTFRKVLRENMEPAASMYRITITKTAMRNYNVNYSERRIYQSLILPLQLPFLVTNTK